METTPYLRSKAAIYYWIVKFILGILSVFTIKAFLDLTLPILLNIPHSLGYFELKLTFVLDILTSNNMFGLNEIIRNVNTLAGGFGIGSMLSFLIYLPLLALGILMPVFYVLDALASFMMLTLNRGLGLMRFTHAVCTIILGFVLGSSLSIMIVTFRSYEIDDSMGVLMIVYMMFAVGMYFLFCFEKGLFRMMYQISLHQQGFKSGRKPTNLSGVSVLCGLMTIVVLLICFAYSVLLERAPVNKIDFYTYSCVALQFFLAAGLNSHVKKHDKIKG